MYKDQGSKTVLFKENFYIFYVSQHLGRSRRFPDALGCRCPPSARRSSPRSRRRARRRNMAAAAAAAAGLWRRGVRGPCGFGAGRVRRSLGCRAEGGWAARLLPRRCSATCCPAAPALPGRRCPVRGRARRGSAVPAAGVGEAARKGHPSVLLSCRPCPPRSPAEARAELPAHGQRPHRREYCVTPLSVAPFGPDSTAVQGHPS